jgi:MaoC dehydratase-like protein
MNMAFALRPRKLGPRTTLPLKAAAAMVPGASKLPWVPGSGDTLPDVELEREVRVDRDHLAKYARVCGFDLRDALPPTYPHVLAFPLHMDVISDGRFPFAPAGIVHIANRIVQHRPLSFSENLSLRVTASGPEPHRRGRTFTLVSEVRVGDELAWEGFATMLKRGKGAEDAPREPEFEDPPVTARWRVPGDLGRRYAAVSGDRNPIHLHPLTARAFGFPRAIAHGMWTKARCLAALRLPDALAADVRFKKPVLLPSTVTFGEADGRFAVHGHLEGTLEPR